MCTTILYRSTCTQLDNLMYKQTNKHTRTHTHTHKRSPCVTFTLQGTMDLVEMVMAKADTRIAVLYDRMLVEERLWGLGEEIRQR